MSRRSNVRIASRRPCRGCDAEQVVVDGAIDLDVVVAHVPTCHRERRRDADEVQARSRERKARHVFESVGRLRYFAAMGVTMEEGEETDHDTARPDRQVPDR